MPAAKRVVGPLADSQRVSNRRFRDVTAWAPRSPGVRERWPARRARRPASSRRSPGRVRLLLLAAGARQPRRRAPGALHAAFLLRRLPARPRLGRDGRALQPAPRARRRLAEPRARRARVRGAGDRDPHDGPHRDDRVARQRGAALRVPPAPPHDEHAGRRQGRASSATLGFAAVAPVVVLLWTRRPETPRIAAVATGHRPEPDRRSVDGVKVAGIQHDIVWEDRDANFARLAPMIAAAASDGARLVVLDRDVLDRLLDGGRHASPRFATDRAPGSSRRKRASTGCGCAARCPSGRRRPTVRSTSSCSRRPTARRIATPRSIRSGTAPSRSTTRPATRSSPSTSKAFAARSSSATTCASPDEFWPLAPSTDCYVRGRELAAAAARALVGVVARAGDREPGVRRRRQPRRDRRRAHLRRRLRDPRSARRAGRDRRRGRVHDHAARSIPAGCRPCATATRSSRDRR